MKLETLRELRRHIRGIDAALQREIESEEMRLQEEKESEPIREQRIIKMKLG